MQLEPNKSDWDHAEHVFEHFSRKPGSKHIASKFALAYLSAILRTHAPKKVLEIGAGIGTITYFLLNHPNSPENLVAVEDHPFCLEQFENNVPHDLMGRVNLINSDALKTLDDTFDLVIIDADFEEEHIFDKFSENTIFFIEGSRKTARNMLVDIAGRRGMKMDLVNYHRGIAPVKLVWRKTRGGVPYPKMKLFKRIKGCWIGSISG